MAATEHPRQIICVTGTDAEKFLQSLITQDIGKADPICYAAILTPQGKYLADFFVIKQADGYWVDVDATLAAGLLQRLSMYKLRADVTLEALDVPVNCGLGAMPDGAVQDPRSPDLPWRQYGLPASDDPLDWTALRVAHVIPETGIELTPDSYILEAGFERLNGVDFRKGCYVGQEVTARMKHKTELRKGLAKVTVSAPVPPGTAITAGGKPVGTLYSQSKGHGIAYLRFDRAVGDMQAGDAVVTR
ncbi:MAG: CAF17-like 4Fe-4S cluster assembly/insertion protein YgfZ [Planktomarina sp.]